MTLLQTNKLYPPHLGGIENVVRDIAEGLAADNNFRSDVLVCQEKGKRSAEKINGVGITRAASLGRLFSLPISFDYFRLFKKAAKNCDLLLIHHPYPLASFARFLFGPKNKPLAVWYHSDIVRQKFLAYLVYPFIYLDLKAAKIIFVSSRRLAENSPLLKKFLDKCRVLPFGIKLDDYRADYKDEVADLHSKYGRFMLAVGRLVYYKGYLDLLAALKSAPGKLLIIGGGPLEIEMKKFIDDNNLQDRVIIISNHPANLIPYYQACEFLVFPSSARSEAFGLVQAEAMACGKPVINTDLPTGVPEVSLNQVSGLTVPVNNPKELSKAIRTLWEDDELRLKFAAGALKRAADNYSQEQFIRNFKEALLK